MRNFRCSINAATVLIGTRPDSTRKLSNTKIQTHGTPLVPHTGNDAELIQFKPTNEHCEAERRGALARTFTQDVDPHAEAALARPVPGHALVDPGVVHGDDLDDEGVKALLAHQHLVVVVGSDGFAVQVPADVGRREASHLESGRGRGSR